MQYNGIRSIVKDDNGNAVRPAAVGRRGLFIADLDLHETAVSIKAG